MFVAIEGVNGVGKSTIIEYLNLYLSKDGFNVITFKQPTDSKLGKFVRNMEEELSGLPYFFLILSDRYKLVEELNKIISKSDSNNIILIDRYILSSIVLQQLDGVNLEIIWEFSKFLPIPDLTILLTGREDIISERLKQRNKKTRLETNFSIKEEMDYFLQGKLFLKQKGFLIKNIDNTKNDINHNILKIKNLILNIKND